MSPCTAKLSAFRSKQAGKYVIPSYFPHDGDDDNNNHTVTIYLPSYANAWLSA